MKEYANEQLRAAVEIANVQLTPDEILILKLRATMSVEEIADAIGMTRFGIHKVLNRVQKKLEQQISIQAK